MNPPALLTLFQTIAAETSQTVPFVEDAIRKLRLPVSDMPDEAELGRLLQVPNSVFVERFLRAAGIERTVGLNMGFEVNQALQASPVEAAARLDVLLTQLKRTHGIATALTQALAKLNVKPQEGLSVGFRLPSNDIRETGKALSMLGRDLRLVEEYFTGAANDIALSHSANSSLWVWVSLTATAIWGLMTMVEKIQIWRKTDLEILKLQVEMTMVEKIQIWRKTDLEILKLQVEMESLGVPKERLEAIARLRESVESATQGILKELPESPILDPGRKNEVLNGMKVVVEHLFSFFVQDDGQFDVALQKSSAGDLPLLEDVPVDALLDMINRLDRLGRSVEYELIRLQSTDHTLIGRHRGVDNVPD